MRTLARPCGPALVYAAWGFLLVAFLTWDSGLGLTHDSAYYLSAGESLATGGSLETFEGKPLLRWPPLLAILAAAFETAGLDPVRALAVVHAAAIALTFALMWTFHRRFLPVSAAVLATAWLALSRPLLATYRLALTEGLFLTLCAAWLTLVTSSSWNSRGRIAGAATLAALAALLRYPGAFLILAGVGVLWTEQGAPVRDRIQRSLLYGTLASSPLVLWLIRNRALSGTWTGARRGSTRSGPEIFESTVEVVTGWILPPGSPTVLGVALLALLVIAFARSPSRGGDAATTSPKRVIAWYGTVYLGIFLVGQWSVGLDAPNSRLLSPLLLICPALVAIPLQRLPELRAGPARRWITPSIIVVSFLWSTVHFSAGVLAWARSGPGGYARPHWQKSAAIQAIAQEQPGAGVEIWSNAPDAAYLVHGVRLRWPRSELPTEGSAALFLWLDRTDRPWITHPADRGFRNIDDYGDGSLWRWSQ